MSQSGIIGCSIDELVELIKRLALTNGGAVRISLVKECGQGYQVSVFTQSPSEGQRVAVLNAGVLVNAWAIRDVIQSRFTPNNAFSPDVALTIDNTICGAKGCVIIYIEGQRVTSAAFVPDIIRP
jgi:hypothetical protein